MKKVHKQTNMKHLTFQSALKKCMKYCEWLTDTDILFYLMCSSQLGELHVDGGPELAARNPGPLLQCSIYREDKNN